MTTLESLQSILTQHEQRIIQLETSLTEQTNNNTLLRAAIAHFETRMGMLEQQIKSSPATTPRGTPTTTRHVKRNSLTNANEKQTTSTASPSTSRTASNKGKPPTRPSSAVSKPSPSTAEKPTIPTGKEAKPESKSAEKTGIPKPKLSSSASTSAIEHKSAQHSANAEAYHIGKHNIYVERPSRYKSMTPSDAAPRQNLSLEYAYGYNGGYRGNLAMTDDNKVVYTLAGTCIVSDLKTQEQSFITEHNEDIVSIAIHPDRKIVATGQRDPKGKATPFILIWDVKTMTVLHRIVYHDRAIIALTFSNDGKYLISIGDDESHTGAIWSWADKQKAVAEGKQHEPLVSFMVAKDEVYGARIVSMDADDKSSFSWVTYGAKHLKVWHAKVGGEKVEVTSRIPATMEITKVVQKAYHAVTPVLGPGFVAGTHDGHIYVFNGRGELSSFHKINDNPAAEKNAPVSALTMDDKGQIYAATCSGNVHVLLSHQGLKDKDKDVNVISIYPNAQPRAIEYHVASNTLIIGTKQGEIIQTSLEWKTSKIVIKGHTDEIWALAIHPTAPHMAVGAHDKILRLWDHKTHQALIQLGLGHGIRYATYNADGSMLAVGHKDGFITVIDTSDIRPGMEYHDGLVFFQKKVHKEQVDALAFSPNGQMLIAGSFDQTISIHEIRSAKAEQKATPRPITGSKKGKTEVKEKEKEDKSKWILTLTKLLKGHTSSISHLMVSSDGKWAASNSRDYEILYWDLDRGVRVTSVDAETKWADWTNLLGWPVQGIWSNAGDGTDVNAVHISANDETPDQDRVIALGDDHGHVTLYAYPALHPKPQHKEISGHSSHVTSVRFTRDSQHLISTGGNDLGIFQWKVTK